MQTPPSPVVQVWTKGRLYPLFVATVALIPAIYFGGLGIQELRSPGASGHYLLKVAGLCLFIAAVAVTLACRRKVTLCAEHLVLRELFRTRIIPLRDIINVFEGRANDSSILISPIEFELPKYKSAQTMALGVSPEEAMIAIAEAAKVAGSPINI